MKEKENKEPEKAVAEALGLKADDKNLKISLINLLDNLRRIFLKYLLLKLTDWIQIKCMYKKKGK